jgi:hypothetical protein
MENGEGFQRQKKAKMIKKMIAKKKRQNQIQNARTAIKKE